MLFSVLQTGRIAGKETLQNNFWTSRGCLKTKLVLLYNTSTIMQSELVISHGDSLSAQHRSAFVFLTKLNKLVSC